MKHRLVVLGLSAGLLGFVVGSLDPLSADRSRSDQATATPALGVRVIADLLAGRDYFGVVQRAAMDCMGQVAYLATPSTLYRVENGQAQPLAERPEENARLQLAPGGGMFAWLLPEPAVQGLYTVRLMQIPDRRLAELRLAAFPFGFAALYLGFEGKLIVTASPLDDWHGFQGRVQYTFWDTQGMVLKEVVFPTHQLGVLDPSGTSILFLGQAEAVAFSAAGDELWRLPGRFRKAAIADSGRFALLNPAASDAIDQVHVFSGPGQPLVIRVATPVHHLVATPDGSEAVIVGDAGRYFSFDRASGTAQEAPPLPLGGTFYVMDAEFVDADSLAFGVLQRVGQPPNVTWPTATIAILDRGGRLAFQRDFPVEEPSASEPAIDLTFGGCSFVGFTHDNTIIAAFER